MLLHLNPSSGVPVYLQLEAQVKQAVAAGALRTGEALPSTRKLAAELRINPNTVARAYQDLERDGVTRSVPGGGTFVADGLPGLLEKRKSEASAAARTAVGGGRAATAADARRDHEIAGRRARQTGRPTMSEAAILTEGLSKSFGTQAAVSNLNLRIQPGAVYGFLGRNGAGKTTTMRMLLGLVRPTKGSARVLGLDPTNETELLRILERVAFVPQRKQLYGWATPAELVRMNKVYFPRWSDEAAAGLAQRLEIPMKTAFKKLSIGNQSKVALLLALAQGAEVLILDEPTAGLDPVMVDEILRTLVEDHVSQGRTIFVSSHHLGEVEQICDWVGILEEGRLLLESRLEEIRQEFRLVIASGEGLPDVASDGCRLRNNRRAVSALRRGAGGGAVCGGTARPGCGDFGNMPAWLTGIVSAPGTQGGCMYAWKCWRETRASFIFLLMLSTAAGLAGNAQGQGSRNETAGGISTAANTRTIRR